ncbi:uncharacterized protein NMK_2191 [Novimethylophilus kurashikiensis]|uniref:Uncharacterized protein n=1 Tax=Novimethylophilus kurashikiensis TaxID=1825523 RepID=A0A2R5F8M0_9PROT|nr:hypothetical protein [Novimethylophilus kurashikiensis]GBG14592.1 uncharacterized protein NMK_2191 [Novimethylophilus kurashikiensis]
MFNDDLGVVARIGFPNTAERIKAELARLTAENIELRTNFKQAEREIQRLSQLEGTVKSVFYAYGQDYPGFIEHLDADGVTLRKDELSLEGALCLMFDMMAARDAELKAANALIEVMQGALEKTKVITERYLEAQASVMEDIQAARALGAVAENVRG